MGPEILLLIVTAEQAGAQKMPFLLSDVKIVAETGYVRKILL